MGKQNHMLQLSIEFDNCDSLFNKCSDSMADIIGNHVF